LKLARYSYTALLLFCLSNGSTAQAASTPWEEGFEGNALNQWETTASQTLAKAVASPTGHLSAQAARIEKPDYFGQFSLSRTLPVEGNTHYSISADLKTLFVGPFAEYYLHTQQLDAGGKVVAQQSFAFNDELSVASDFGGIYKTPQTLNEWRKTRHSLTTHTEAKQLKLIFYFRNGAQTVLLDNVQVEAATGELASGKKQIFVQNLDSASALLDFDQLVPGFTYELRARVDKPDTEGWGITWQWFDRKNTANETTALARSGREGDVFIYRLSIPETATRVRLQLFSDDLVTLGWAKESAYRRWKELKIYQVATLPAVDTLFHNYLHKVSPNPEWTKPSTLLDYRPEDEQLLQAGLAKREAVDVSVASHRGGMAIKVGEKLVAPLWAATLPTKNLVDSYSAVGKQGIDFIRVSVDHSGVAFNGMWQGEHQYDFSPIDEAIYRALKQNPNACIIFDAGGLYPPFWWGDQHPDEIMQNPDGLSLSIYGSYAYHRMWGKMSGPNLHQAHEKLYQGNNWLKNWGAKVNTTYFPSPASRPYRAAMKTYLQAMRRYIESQPYGKAVVGYQLTWGYDMQWGWPTVGRDDKQVGKPDGIDPQRVDYSPPMRRYFREYLQRVYQTDSALQHAWNNPAATLATAEPPSPAQRAKATDAPRNNYLLDPATDRALIDWENALSESVGDLADELGIALKQAGSRKVLVTGYFQDIARSIGTDRILQGQGIDILGGPDYTGREIGQSGLSPFAFTSYQLHNKISFTEVDHRLFSVMYREYRGNQVFETPRKSISVLQREMARQMVRGDGAWLLDMGFGWHSQPIIAQTLGDIRQVWQQAVEADRSSVAKVALITDEDSVHARAVDSYVGILYNLQRNLRNTLSQSGIAYDTYHIRDLDQIRDRYSVYIFSNAYSLSDKNRAAIERLKNNNRLLVFGPAAGYLSDTKRSVENMRQLTGIDLAQNDSLPMSVQWKPGLPSTQELAGFAGTQLSNIHFPRFYATDANAQTWAEFTGPVQRPGIVSKKLANWQSVYIGVIGDYPPEFWRAVARLQNIHVYSSQNDVMWANRSMVAVHAAFNGVHKIRLPEKKRVVDLWTGRDFGVTDGLTIQMETGDNLFLQLK